jgi:16S rRNA (uracil1498-N3)-methyltransferase
MRRFFAEPDRCRSSQIELDENESKHLAQVFRARVGEEATVLNGAGDIFDCAIEKIAKRSVTLAIRSKKHIPPLPYELHLFQAIPKGKVMDWIVQKATELGARKIVPVITERTIVDPHEAKIEKWRAIAIESIKQCGSPYLPEIAEPIPFKSAPKTNFGLVASLHPGAREISDLKLQSACQIWVGPEGDFTPAEVEALLSSGVHPITLGPLVLRCDTAAVASLTLAGSALRNGVQSAA